MTWKRRKGWMEMVDRGNGILYLFVSGFFIGVGSESKDFVPWPAAL